MYLTELSILNMEVLGLSGNSCEGGGRELEFNESKFGNLRILFHGSNLAVTILSQTEKRRKGPLGWGKICTREVKILQELLDIIPFYCGELFYKAGYS
jgi:hypothetical protein